MTNWKVVHRFKRGMNVVEPIIAYRQLGITLRYDDNGKLTEVEHDFEADGGLASEAAVQVSTEALTFFWEVLSYWWGLPLNFAGRTAQRISAEDVGDGSRKGFVTAEMSACVALPIRLPPQEFFAEVSDRLRVHLWLANRARNASSDAEAIRDYFIILEDWLRSGEQEESATAKSLKYTRHFVSHAKVDDDLLRAFLKEQLGEDTSRFDPADGAHQRFVRLQRRKARSFIEGRLERKLEG